MTASERLKNVREALGKGQKEMAELLGINYRTYQNYEKSLNDPNWDTCEALVRLGFNANWLLTGEGEMKRGGGQQVASGNGFVQGHNVEADSIHIDVHHPPAIAEGSTDWQRVVTADRPGQKQPTLDSITKQLRLIIEMYEHLRPGCESDQKARNIAMIFRHFVDNYQYYHDEVEITEYIEEWF